MSSKKSASHPRRKSRVVVVSNRLPVTLSKLRDEHHILTRSSGGLVSAIEPLRNLYSLTWIGSLGAGTNLQNRFIKKGQQDFRYIAVNIQKREWNLFYNGFSNRALWPLLHYMIEHCVFDHEQWLAYEAVNRKFADKIIKSTKANDLIWIHDFHLMLVPKMIRDQRPESRIGFFLHTPFPSSEMFRVFPWRNQILNGLLGADVIGFHTYDYLRHFRSSLLRILGIDSEMSAIQLLGRKILLNAIPVGADWGNIARFLKDSKVQAKYQEFKKHTQKIKILLGVDRLDYTKGIDRRLEAYEMFLENYPEWRGKVEFFQIMVPSRTEVESYKDLKRRVDQIAGRINAQYGRWDWTPIRCFYRQLAMDDLMNYYARANVAVVTPLRDGMNLVAKEFILAQHVNDPGVLVLSEFAGAAAELADAVSVNPYSCKDMMEAFRTALSMESSEIKRRYQSMYQALTVHTAEKWGRDFVESLRQSARVAKISAPLLRIGSQRSIRANFRHSQHRLLLLDYDGTLAPIVSHPLHAAPSLELKKLLTQLSQHPRNTVAVVSGRDRDILQSWLADTGVYLCAEHGAWIWNKEQWIQNYVDSHPSWKDKIRPVLQTYTARTAGSFIEEKSEALAWHYRLCEPEYGAWQAQNLAFNLESYIQSMPLQCLMGKKVIEVRYRDVHKGTVWKWFKKQFPKTDFVLACGDDRTDEDLFLALPKSATCIHIGETQSAAPHRLNTPKELLQFLQSL